MANFTEKQLQTAAANMIAYGGSFMQNIGKALQRADRENTQKIIQCWGNDIKNYLKY